MAQIGCGGDNISTVAPEHIACGNDLVILTNTNKKFKHLNFPSKLLIYVIAFTGK